MKIMKQKKLLLTIMLLAFTSVLLTSCYPDYGLTTSDFDIVATFKDDAADFQTYGTFFMPDSIKRLSDGIGSSGSTQYDEQILDEIVNQMEDYGYTRVASESTADVGVYVATTSSENYVYYPGYWYGYYGWYYPWYGGYSYSYSTGSLFVTMIDREKIDEPNKISGAVWAGTINGLLDDSYGNIAVRVTEGIDKMFGQSPYLRIIE